MNAPLADLVTAGLGVMVLVEPDAAVELSWAQSSDLDDPTPFTEPGQLLLTTGRQFDEWGEPDYRRFVERLAAAGIAALGFGAGVVCSQTPPELIAACRTARLPLLEVPYETPFIAIGRWVADRQQAAARARLEWTLQAQGVIANAAIGAGRLAAALSRAGQLLDAQVSILDTELVPIAGLAETRTAGLRPLVATEARRVLHGRRRASVDVETDDVVVRVHTLGRGGHLRGVLTAERSHRFDDAERSVLTTLTALVEVSLEHAESVRESVQALMAELFILLRDGRTDMVRNTISGLPAGIPDRRFRVLALDADDSGESLLASLARQAAAPKHRTFHVVNGKRNIFLVDIERWPALRGQVELSGARAGLSAEVGWDALNAGVLQAVRALEAAPAGRLRTFDEVVSSSISGLLAESSVIEIAAARLAPILEKPDGMSLLTEAAVWLARNGQWDPAARELHLHRHTLKAHMGELGGLLGLDLQRFPARAELWAMLNALGIIAGHGERPPTA